MKPASILFLLSCFLLSLSCKQNPEPLPEFEEAVIENSDSVADFEAFAEPGALPLTALEVRLKELGLVELSEVDPSIVVDLRYSGEDNFMGQDIYGDFDRAWLQPEVAEMLKNAQSALKQRHPGYSIVVFDAARPLSIQQKMWDITDLPVAEKSKYLSNPKKGSVHNYGAAVDVSLVDENGEELDMGTPYDFFGEEAHPENEPRMLAAGKLTQGQVENRKLLRSVMKAAGFSNIPSEWWHFNAYNRETAKQKFPLIE
jgi:zinc D-Ala-D-Ala dipeptidase